ncbi:MAG: hypothetical protein JW873_06310 [Candidatus Saganbacteria bacterium]|nr:hypothetical protein [Candidatus Saganbacteria bacterium]
MRKFIGWIIMIIALAAGCYAAGSASYRLPIDAMGGGGGSSASATYRLFKADRERELQIIASAAYRLGEGFLRAAAGQAVLAPIVTLIEPDSGPPTGPVAITNLAGANFLAGASVKLSRSGQADISGSSVAVVSAGKITCVFDLTGAASGAWDVTVTNSDGRSGTLPSAFTVNHPAPAVTAITPPSGVNDTAVNITDLAGTGFRAGAAVRLTQTGQPDIIATAVNVAAPTRITCSFDLTGKALGQWDVVVTNNDGQSGTLSGGFKIEAATIYATEPVVSSQNPYNPSLATTSLRYSLSKDANIVIYIYNMRGERIWQYAAPASSVGGRVGANVVAWDGVSAFKQRVPEGVYFVDLTTQDGGFRVLSRTKIAVVR